MVIWQPHAEAETKTIIMETTWATTVPTITVGSFITIRIVGNRMPLEINRAIIITTTLEIMAMTTRTETTTEITTIRTGSMPKPIEITTSTHQITGASSIIRTRAIIMVMSTETTTQIEATIGMIATMQETRELMVTTVTGIMPQVSIIILTHVTMPVITEIAETVSRQQIW